MYTASFYEKKQHGTKKFPVAYYYVDHSHPQYNMPFHWHREWELIRVKKGQLVLHIDESEYYAKEGDVLLLHESMFHGGAAAAGVYECLVFDCYGLFHDMAPIKEFVRPFYRLKYLPQILYTKEEYPEISKIVEDIMDGNDQYEKEQYLLKTAKDEKIFERKDRKENQDEDPRENRKENLEGDLREDLHGEQNGFRELATVSGLGRLIALILQKQLYKENKEDTVRSTHRISRIKTVLEYVERHYQASITLNDMAEVAGMNPQYFCRAFKDITMQSPMDYVIVYRLDQAIKLLAATDLSVTEIALECGFNDCSYFIRVFKKHKNMTPHQYRKRLPN